MRHPDRFLPDETDSCPQVTVVASANQLTLTGHVWSLRWAAPEIVKEEDRPSLASDIRSAGWVCWEVRQTWYTRARRSEMIIHSMCGTFSLDDDGQVSL